MSIFQLLTDSIDAAEASGPEVVPADQGEGGAHLLAHQLHLLCMETPRG